MKKFIMNEECPVERQTECTQNMEDISAVINITDDLVIQLENKLNNVLKITDPPKNITETEDEKILVPLAFELRHQKKRLENINDAIQNIINRLEN